MSKDSLVKGTLILTLAALVARALGVVQRVPLVNLLGDDGMASYTVAFNIYSLFLVVATAGIPSALSKMVSERTAIGAHEEASRIYRAALWFGAAAGLLMCAVLFFVAPYYLVWTHNPPEALLAIRAIAPALLLFPFIAMMRGYFQGQRHMMPNGISQIVEQIFRVVVSVLLAFVLLAYGLEWAVAGASFGGVIGGLAALAVMLYFARRFAANRKRELAAEAVGTDGAKAAATAASGATAADGAKAAATAASGAVAADGAKAMATTMAASGARAAQGKLSYRSIYSQLLKLAVPIVIFSVTVTLVYAIDSSIVIQLLMGSLGVEGATEILGMLGGRAQPLAGIPIILAVALSQSIVPIISAAYSRNDAPQLSDQTGKVLKLSILSGLPMILVICASARPLNEFIFQNKHGSPWVDQYAAPMIIALTVTAIFQIVMQTSGAVLMGMGRMKPLMTSVAAGIAIKLAASFALAPLLGIYGIIGATALCFIVMTFINLAALRKVISFRVLGGRRWAGLLLTTALIAAVAWLMDGWADRSLNPFASAWWNAVLQAVLLAGLAGVLYPALLLATRTMTLSDLEHLPGPLRKLAKPLLRMLKR